MPSNDLSTGYYIVAIVSAFMICSLSLPASAQQLTVYAKSFSTRAHAGTVRDPWPGSAIAKAANSLPATGGTVVVGNGIWLFSVPTHIPRGNFILQGTSLSAQLYFTNGVLTIGPYGNSGSDVANVTINGLTIDASHINSNNGENEAVQVWQCNGCELTNSVVYGHTNNSLAAFITFGGSNWQIMNNKIVSKTNGGAQLQLNPIANDLNSGFVISSNEFDSIGVLAIGVSDLHVTHNYMHNKTLGNFIAMSFAAPYGGANANLVFDYNTIDATVGNWNGAVVAGQPQDAGGGGSVHNVTVDHNTMRGSSSLIAVTTYDTSCLAQCSDLAQTFNIQITNNNLDSLYGGSQIDVSGGTSGSVNGGVVQGNTLINGCSCGQPNEITQDAHTSGVTITNNSFENTIF